MALGGLQGTLVSQTFGTEFISIGHESMNYFAFLPQFLHYSLGIEGQI
jgi:hypothetical protein